MQALESMEHQHLDLTAARSLFGLLLWHLYRLYQFLNVLLLRASHPIQFQTSNRKVTVQHDSEHGLKYRQQGRKF
jgi:hypothetical protein